MSKECPNGSLKNPYHITTEPQRTQRKHKKAGKWHVFSATSVPLWRFFRMPKCKMSKVHSVFVIHSTFGNSLFVISRAGLPDCTDRKTASPQRARRSQRVKRRSESPFSSSLCPCALCGSAVCVVIAPGAVAASFATTRVSQRFQQRAATAKERSAPPLRG